MNTNPMSVSKMEIFQQTLVEKSYKIWYVWQFLQLKQKVFCLKME